MKQDAEVLEEREEALKNFVCGLKELEDPRLERHKRYSLQEIFLLVLCAQINGFESFRDYVTYGELKLNFLRHIAPYADGIPSKSTIARVLALFSPMALESLFREWMERLLNAEQQEIVAIDGKRHCGYQEKEVNEHLHLVHACAIRSGLSLGQEAVAEKSNEITAIPKLIDSLALKGQLITLDALGCQKKIAEHIIAKKADYLFGLKGNQSGLHEDVKLYFSSPHHMSKCQYIAEDDKGHGRIERREAYICDNVDWLEQRSEWAGLSTLIWIKSSRLIKDQESREDRYYISSLNSKNPKTFLQATRMHWGVESMHWSLDVTFREDDRIVWNRNVAQNEAIIRRVALNLLKQYQVHRETVLGKRKIALKSLRKVMLLDDDGMFNLLFNKF
jgi:predicted transposase YbfD/YdcC